MFLTLVAATDCDLAISLAQGLNMHVVNSLLMNRVQMNCCTAPGIICSGQNVTQITWNGRGLNGTINSTAIPLQLDLLHLYVNSIHGNVPHIPTSAVKYLILYNNKLNGTMQSFPYMSFDVRVHLNEITGSIPNYPNTLALFYNHNNKMTGQLPPMRPFNLYVSNNMLTGSIPSLLADMKYLRVDGNLLSGPMPPIPGTLLNLDINTPSSYSNVISGILSFNQPLGLLLFNSNFTAITITNNASLNYCDISYNPLSSLYTNNLSGCIQEGTGVNYKNYSEVAASALSLTRITSYMHATSSSREIVGLESFDSRFVDLTTSSSLDFLDTPTITNTIGTTDHSSDSVTSTSTKVVFRGTLKRNSIVTTTTDLFTSFKPTFTILSITKSLSVSTVKERKNNNDFLSIQSDPFAILIVITIFMILRVFSSTILLGYICYSLIIRYKKRTTKSILHFDGN